MKKPEPRGFKYPLEPLHTKCSWDLLALQQELSLAFQALDLCQRQIQNLEADRSAAINRLVLQQTGKSGFFAAHGTDTDTLIDVEGGGFDLAFFQTPAFRAGVLEVDVGKIKFVCHQSPENVIELMDIKLIGDKQCVARCFQQRVVAGGQNAGLCVHVRSRR